jgi:hypothetical protein
MKTNKVLVCGLFAVILAFAACDTGTDNNIHGTGNGNGTGGGHTHSYGQWTNDTPATCTEPLKQKRTCVANDGATETQSVGNALGHNFGAYSIELDNVKNLVRTCTRANCNKEEKIIDGNNITPPAINLSWNDDDARDEIKLVLESLKDQSQILTNQYQNSDCDAQLKSMILMTQSELRNTFKAPPATGILIANTVAVAALNVFRGLNADIEKKLPVDKRDLFDKYFDAFYTVHILKQREYWVKPNGLLPNTAEPAAKAAFATTCAQIQQLEGGKLISTPASKEEAQTIINNLRSKLETLMPEECGPYKNGLIQQWEDFVQFDGWTSDIATLGKSTIISQSISQASTIQESNKLGTFIAANPDKKKEDEETLVTRVV